MKAKDKLILAVKSAPDESIFLDIRRAGIGAVELYLSDEIMLDAERIYALCEKYPFRYAVHAPPLGCSIDKLVELTNVIRPEVVVFHNTFWDDEWTGISEAFKKTGIKVCIENTYSVHEPVKFERRYGFGRCVDIEHLQMECAGVYEEEFIKIIQRASHIHLTGYEFGGNKWHTHIHHSRAHGRYLLGLLVKAGYSGFVVSEARTNLQVYKEFLNLVKFWENVFHEKE
jgi:hypothetical protein